MNLNPGPDHLAVCGELQDFRAGKVIRNCYEYSTLSISITADEFVVWREEFTVSYVAVNPGFYASHNVWFSAGD